MSNIDFYIIEYCLMLFFVVEINKISSPIKSTKKTIVAISITTTIFILTKIIGFYLTH